MAETREVLVKVDIDRKGADTGLGAIKTKGDKATKSLEGTKKSAEDTGKSLKTMASDTQLFGVSVNTLSAGFTAFKGTLSKSIASLKVFKIALAATGIGLLVIAIGAVITFLTRMQDGMDIVSKAMAQVGAVVDVILDRFAKLGQVITSFGDIVTKAFKGDFVGAIEAGKQAGEELRAVFVGIGDEIAREVRLAGDLADALVVLEDQEISNIALQAERRRDIAKLLLLTKDETKSSRERLKAAQDAEGLEKAILEENIRLQTERVRLAEEELGRAESSREDERAFAQEKAKLFQLEEGSLKKLRAIALETLKFQRLVIGEEAVAAEEKKILAEFEELEKQLNHERALARPFQELEGIKGINVEKVAISQEFLNTIDAQLEAQGEKNVQRAADNAEREKVIAQAKAAALLGFVQQGLASQQKFAKIAAKLNQGLAIKEIFISTRESIIKANADVPFPFSLVVGALYAALGIASAAAVAGIQFFTGGKIKAPGAPRSGDKVHIRANPGEVILNQSQQSRLGGAPTFRKIGVPGFQDGGVVPGASFPLTNDFNSITDAISRMNLVVTVEDINEGQERVEVVANRAEIIK